MDAQQRYNAILNSIENYVLSRTGEYEVPIDYIQVSNQAFEAAGCDYLDNRSRNEVLKFMTGKTVNQYINERVMMHVYKEILCQNSFDQTPLINIAGVSSESSLYKKFKEEFNISPREAFNKKDPSLYKDIVTWDDISDNKQTTFVERVEVEVVKEVQVRVVNKWPFIITIASIIVIIIAIILGLNITNHRKAQIEKWTGLYKICTLLPKDTNQNQLYFSENNSASIDWISKKFNYSIFDNEYEMHIDRIDESSFSAHSEIDGLSVTGQRQDDGIICLTEEKDQGKYVDYLIKDDYFSELQKRWDGWYQFQLSTSSDDNALYYDFDEMQMLISIQNGLVIYYFNDEIYDGFITYLGIDSIELMFENYCEGYLFECESLGDSSFEYHMPWGDTIDTNHGETTIRAVRIGDFPQ